MVPFWRVTLEFPLVPFLRNFYVKIMGALAVTFFSSQLVTITAVLPSHISSK